MKNKIIKFFNFCRGFFPAKLPTGVTEFHAWADKFIATYSLPTKDVDSIKFIMAAELINLRPTTFRRSYRYFYSIIHTAATKQLASAVFTEIKTKQKEAAKAAEEALKNEQSK